MCRRVKKSFCKENSFEIEVYSGLDGLVKISVLDEIDMVVTSVVGKDRSCTNN